MPTGTVARVLALDHVFCFVAAPGPAARRLEAAGWTLDAGQAHRGQGTRNRRLIWPGVFFELLWVEDIEEARANPLRLDLRAAWASTGASPVGIAFRGRLEPAAREAYWPYEALGPRIWIPRAEVPERPLAFVIEADEEVMAMRRRAQASVQPGLLEEVRVGAPAAPVLPPHSGPPVVHVPGPHRLELVAGAELEIAPHLALRAG